MSFPHSSPKASCVPPHFHFLFFISSVTALIYFPTGLTYRLFNFPPPAPPHEVLLTPLRKITELDCNKMTYYPSRDGILKTHNRVQTATSAFCVESHAANAPVERMRTIIPRKLMFLTFSQDSSLAFGFQEALFFCLFSGQTATIPRFLSKLASLADPPKKFKQLKKTATKSPSDWDEQVAFLTLRQARAHGGRGVKLARLTSHQSVCADDTLLSVHKMIHYIHIVTNDCF